MARLTQGSLSESKTCALWRQAGVKAPTVTGVRPEAGRSSPGQGEVRRKPDGGLLELLRFKSLS